MQVSATLIAAQQAAREARARLAMPQAAQQPGFAAALEKTEGFSPLPLKQTAASAATALNPQPAQGSAPARMGQHVDITV
ncbi:MAG TPA: hypothetical protein VHX18_12410 [Rhizomicrobium sp.]|jgi:hypothetical protein|nr:hypothetical protein [Rhizomicrobium sp.]